MLTCRSIAFLAKAGAAAAALCLAAPVGLAPALALDGGEPPPAAAAAPVITPFASPRDALRKGIKGYQSGDVKSSLEALTYAAAQGQPLAAWKLGQMYANGDGVPHDDLKAYDYFSKIVESYDEENPDRREISVVANAFVAVGVYSLTGIANTHVAPDPERALEVFQYAATNFSDADAQYNLARMYLDGNSVDKDPRQGTRWLALAADKGHRAAEALLGHLLFNGQAGLPKQRAKGLMWLELARTGADEKKDRWILELYKEVTALASDPDKQAAAVYAGEFARKRK
jgi:uncharacterized protein